jgi:hypothetical protein
MKRIVSLLLMLTLFAAPAFARPQQVRLKTSQTKAREAEARSLGKKLDLSKVDDPDARLILRALLNAVDVGYKEPARGKR